MRGDQPREPFPRCYKCFRPRNYCLCGEIAPIYTGIKYLFLMHPREAYQQKTGTGRLAALSLEDSEIIVGIDFTQNSRLNELLASPEYFPVLLYPREGALEANTPELAQAVRRKKLLVVLIDATWFFAKKMLKASGNLTALPAISFSAPYRSAFEFKRQPHPQCLSTIESVYYLTEELKRAGIAARDAQTDGLMRVFKTMVRFQLDKEQERHEAEAYSYSMDNPER